MPSLTTRANHRALSIAIEYTELDQAYVLPETHHDPHLLSKIFTGKLAHARTHRRSQHCIAQSSCSTRKGDIAILMDDDSEKYAKPTYENGP